MVSPISVINLFLYPFASSVTLPKPLLSIGLHTFYGDFNAREQVIYNLVSRDAYLRIVWWVFSLVILVYASASLQMQGLCKSAAGMNKEQ